MLLWNPFTLSALSNWGYWVLMPNLCYCSDEETKAQTGEITCSMSQLSSGRVRTTTRDHPVLKAGLSRSCGAPSVCPQSLHTCPLQETWGDLERLTQLPKGCRDCMNRWITRLCWEKPVFFFFFFCILVTPCSMWDLKFPDQGLNPHPLYWRQRLTHWTTREI